MSRSLHPNYWLRCRRASADDLPRSLTPLSVTALGGCNRFLTPIDISSFELYQIFDLLQQLVWGLIP
ncbi:hypothetical protein [Gloeothece verrucosa]|uniref:hypothetical protein n=1 Tax=Gloeothece verrucosa TaxID=2546359 RepID=UPI000310A2B3|nr:hypothetical protein [Gloeothece verrucosa]